ncbi:hypothetical protein SAMN05421776_105349 [Nocardia farcinica]|uniref:Uncharacterized protein n=1 Tax=Nocardia farcinica TaxID=37329 RepID=A0A0H5NED9_NOCFR|nr:hypothetical protein [Nocardia farcinica]PFX04010.1 hypothetical protein CJ469_01884 [Nocardia farcinica]PFX10168.1 hypothetical protein CJ468_01015 [Nocardia farcinica]UEX21180.1 hypothetical protein LMJ57_19460 [Nocardia farcinica]CRY73679.1 Uncharacterised protein [Nocardia farcinica]SIT24814.1 hypothetical protein SAMN05421776_105349 [Nocardia farcinica]
MPTPKKPGAKKRRGKSAGNSVTSPATMARHQAAMDLSVQGFSYAEIAERLGYGSGSAARYAVNAAFKRAATESAEHLRPRLAARAELMWRHGIAMMLEGRSVGDLDQFEKGARVADRAYGRMLTIHGLAGPGITVNQQFNTGDAATLDQLKAEFTALMQDPPAVAPGDVVDGEVVATEDSPP